MKANKDKEDWDNRVIETLRHQEAGHWEKGKWVPDDMAKEFQDKIDKEVLKLKE